MRFIQNGKEFEFNGTYRTPRDGELFLNKRGAIEEAYDGGAYGVRAIVYPFPKTHTFCDITYKETGEYRRAEAGETVLGETMFLSVRERTVSEFIILKAIGIANES